MKHMLKNKVLATELIKQANVTINSIYAWKNFNSLTKLNQFIFISLNDIYYNGISNKEHYINAFNKCTKWDEYLPASYFATMLELSPKYFKTLIDEGNINKIWFEYMKVVHIYGIKVPNDIEELYKRGKIVHYVRNKNELKFYEGFIKINDKTFGYY